MDTNEALAGISAELADGRSTAFQVPTGYGMHGLAMDLAAEASARGKVLVVQDDYNSDQREMLAKMHPAGANVEVTTLRTLLANPPIGNGLALVVVLPHAAQDRPRFRHLATVLSGDVPVLEMSHGGHMTLPSASRYAMDTEWNVERFDDATYAARPIGPWLDMSPYGVKLSLAKTPSAHYMVLTGIGVENDDVNAQKLTSLGFKTLSFGRNDLLATKVSYDSSTDFLEGRVRPVVDRLSSMFPESVETPFDPKVFYRDQSHGKASKGSASGTEEAPSLPTP